MFEPQTGDRVRVLTREFDSSLYAYGGKHGVISSTEGRYFNVVIDGFDHPFPFKDGELEQSPSAFEAGERVLINSAQFPVWNGEAIVEYVTDDGLSVVPLEGRMQGSAGWFQARDIAKHIPLPEWEQEILDAAGVEPEPVSVTDGLYDLAEALSDAATRSYEVADFLNETSDLASLLAEKLGRIEKGVIFDAHL